MASKAKASSVFEMDNIPFPAKVELISELTESDMPEGNAACLDKELSCPLLEELYPNLDFVARKSNDHIDPLHKHLQNGRKIVLTEDPGLHLVWSNGIVYIKPLPRYLLSHSFWVANLAPGSDYRGKALGFVRSYERLIRYPSDFELAKEARLIPSGLPRHLQQGHQQQQPLQEELTYTVFFAFISHFSSIKDPDVSPRWHFGQIRLSRLNWIVRILQPKAARKNGFIRRLFYEQQLWQTGDLVNEFAAPLLFSFAALSLILSAMQVVLAAKSGDDKGSWRVFAEMSAYFAVLVIVMLVIVVVGLVAIVIGLWVSQFHFGYRSWKRSRAGIKVANVEAHI